MSGTHGSPADACYNRINALTQDDRHPNFQYSLAFEKASIIFNICAVLSCLAASRIRSEEADRNFAFKNFQASASMFTYINENFLNAPSSDLHKGTVSTLIQIMLAQGQEVFLENRVAEGDEPIKLAKIASRASDLYSQAVVGTQAMVSVPDKNAKDGERKEIPFDKVWQLVVQVRYLPFLFPYNIRAFLLGKYLAGNRDPKWFIPNFTLT